MNFFSIIDSRFTCTEAANVHISRHGEPSNLRQPKLQVGGRTERLITCLNLCVSYLNVTFADKPLVTRVSISKMVPACVLFLIIACSYLGSHIYEASVRTSKIEVFKTKNKEQLQTLCQITEEPLLKGVHLQERHF